jgi:uncharacterized protein (DUF2252 family)
MSIGHVPIGSDPPGSDAAASSSSTPPESRRAVGRQARGRVPRRSLGVVDVALRHRGAVEILESQNAGRLTELVPIRFGRMMASPWTFYRGAAAVMAADLAARPHTDLMVQMCGDAHVLNFGLWATPERNLSFDLRDFDETLPGPFEWDVARLATSLVVLARDNALDAARADVAVERCLRSYRTHMRSYARSRQMDIWYDLIDVTRLVSRFSRADRELATNYIARKAERRTSRGAVGKLTTVVNGHLRITEDPPRRVHLGPDELALVVEVFARYRESLPQYRRHLLDRFRFCDAVRQVVGVGSVGMRVYLVLLEGRDGADPLFLQVKQAGPSVYEEHLGPSGFETTGERVAVGKRLIQSATDIFVGWTVASDGTAYYVRQFRDMKVIPDGALIAPRLAEFSEACGAVLARAHARTGDATAIAAYIGNGEGFVDALGDSSFSYADQTEVDHRQLGAAVQNGEITAQLD